MQIECRFCTHVLGGMIIGMIHADFNSAYVGLWQPLTAARACMYCLGMRVLCT